MGLPQPLTPQAPLLEGAGAEALDQHVGAGAQRAQGFSPLGRAQIAPHRLDPAEVGPKARPDAVDDRRRQPHGVAQARVLDLDHPRAEVHQHAHEHRPGQHARGVDHQVAGERERRHGRGP
ncbi:hypothetical protein D3C87_1844000 [compost metagenome]